MTMEDSDSTLSVVSSLPQFLPGALKMEVVVQDNNDDGLCCALFVMLGSQLSPQRPSSGGTARDVVHGCIAILCFQKQQCFMPIHL